MLSSTIGLILWLATGFYFMYLIVVAIQRSKSSLLLLNTKPSELGILSLLELLLLLFIYFCYSPNPDPDVAGGFLWENLYTYPKGIALLLIEFPEIKDSDINELMYLLFFANAMFFNYIVLLIVSTLTNVFRSRLGSK